MTQQEWQQLSGMRQVSLLGLIAVGIMLPVFVALASWSTNSNDMSKHRQVLGISDDRTTTLQLEPVHQSPSAAELLHEPLESWQRSQR